LKDSNLGAKNHKNRGIKMKKTIEKKSIAQTRVEGRFEVKK